MSDGRGAHSPFITALLQSSAGTGNDEECDIEMLKKEIENRVSEMADVRQTPTGGTLDGDAGGCFLFFFYEKARLLSAPQPRQDGFVSGGDEPRHDDEHAAVP